VVLENHSGRATRPRKKFDIFIRFDTIPVCDGQRRFDSKDRASSVSRRFKCKLVLRAWLCEFICCNESGFDFEKIISLLHICARFYNSLFSIVKEVH